MAATNAAGTTTVRYGKMRANVLALEAVLADGRVIRTGSRAAKTSAGYDLTGLLVGSEGTLAVITEVTVRLHAIPEHVVALRISFPDVESACRTAAAVVAAGAGVTRIELLDAWFVAAVNAYSGTAYPEGPCLFVEATGSEELVDADLELVQAIAGEEGATEIVHERDPDARARLWKARHDVAHALAATVPGHEGAGDGRLRAAHGARGRGPLRPLGDRAARPRRRHPRARRRRQPPRRVQVAARARSSASEELVHNIVDDALARGGTCTGEHGVGLGKIGALEQEHGDLIPLMQAIKASFDPNGIINPGKVLPSRGRCRRSRDGPGADRSGSASTSAARSPTSSCSATTAPCAPRRCCRRRTTTPAASSTAPSTLLAEHGVGAATRSPASSTRRRSPRTRSSKGTARGRRS